LGIIEVEGLRKTYGNLVAVDGISFEVAHGEILGILGPNGSGKTTTLKSLLGLITFDAGNVRLKGIDVARNRTGAVRYAGAILEGARNIYWYLSPEENLIYFAGIKGRSRRSVSRRIDQLLETLDLEGVRDKEVREFSSGMKQKTALACALVHDPEVLLLDEPTLGLDVETSASVRKMLRSLVRNDGKTILITSHDMSFVESVCDRVLIIRQGRIVSHETIASLRNKFSNKIYSLRIAGTGADSFAVSIGNSRQAAVEPSEDGSVQLSMRLEEPMQLLGILRDLERDGLSLLDLRVVESSLEDIFLDLMGKIWE